MTTDTITLILDSYNFYEEKSQEFAENEGIEDMDEALQ